jgi:multidrug efflux pump subunit AcrA (membrane-fusion protein)
MQVTYRLVLLFAATLVLLSACGKKQETRRPDPVVNVTASAVVRQDLPILETAVGAETALGATNYDPTRIGRGTSYIRLPFPQHVAARLKLGQTVMISNFAEPARAVKGTIREIRPALNATTVSNEVIVTVPSMRDWRPEGSVRGVVTLGVHRNAIVVPEQAVVMRPAGSVVYVVDGKIAKERPVRTGITRDGIAQITKGLDVGEVVAVDGAALLSDGAKINVLESDKRP